MSNFADRLLKAIDEKENPSVVGLDPRIGKIPGHIKDQAVQAVCGDGYEAAAEALYQFGRGIIDAVYDIVPAVKPQRAFFEMYGSAGIRAFERLVDYAKQQGLIVIEDAKRNDIGSTAEAYAAGHLGSVPLAWGTSPVTAIDAMTVNPYLGSDGIKPFLEQCGLNGKGIFVLAKTSNPSSGELQDKLLQSSREPVYKDTARQIDEWGKGLVGEEGFSSVGAVVGATYPQQAEELRGVMPNTIFLIPGYGKQGGGSDGAVTGFTQEGRGGIVNSSRAVIFAYEDNDRFGPEQFGDAARAEAERMRTDLRGALQRADKFRW
ncbi:orotidine-5'-phosphate decarboxylase [Candidatus Aenigmatarchaeota archaeon]